MAQPKVRVGLVGANWGLTHVAAWKSLPDVDLVAICTSNQKSADAAASANGIPNAFGDPAEMMAALPLDIVDITPRPAIRAPIALAALEAGKHVIQPMPFALNLDQARRLHGLAKSRNLVAVVENLHRHSPTFRQAKEMIDTGAIGEVKSVKAFVRTNILLDPGADFPYLWLIDPDSGASALRNFGAQMLHVLHWFFGPISSVSARLKTNLPMVQPANGSAIANGVVDSASVLIDFASGVDAILDTSWCLPGQNQFSLEIAGSRGRIVIEATGLGPRNAMLQVTTNPHVAVQPMTIEERFRQGSTVESRDDALESLAFMCRNVADAVIQANPTIAAPDFGAAMHVMNVVEAAYRSNRNERREPVDLAD
ncbi:Gfo/Idh/MocA family oxidoreductase [Rhizorhabdus sp.]|jgi:predicted dehydrogenase|uniref:Gfo/Idh/MocA family protein n=1 Tax=Rhizorhabdus sp. TaxID=1968843 RepID=UPI0019CDA824|nr:Gfo/Idh/MocA family oxidoreductase [Rhizorhabdus sp.]MBD3759601.1 Gfo/Idh/MocA family oxidoreductase [Rhizorhabdus sp.]